MSDEELQYVKKVNAEIIERQFSVMADWLVHSELRPLSGDGKEKRAMYEFYAKCDGEQIASWCVLW
jgi:hypothetical protein